MVNYKGKKMLKHQRNRVSFSANLPEDVHGAFTDSTCVVKYSMDPLTDIRESIKEMVKNVGIKDWKEMEELVYCYIFLNSEEVHCFIKEAFLSLCS
uniref:Transcription repressor n=1 Tax=Solanum tuberosum TaxID=4113 RepID=M1CL00_SOLTU